MSPKSDGIQCLSSLSLGLLVSHYGGFQFFHLLSMLHFLLACFSLPHKLEKKRKTSS